MYLLSQIWLYLLIAFLIGALVGWFIKSCFCNTEALQAEIDGLRTERDDLNTRLLAAGAGAAAGVAVTSQADAAKIARLEAELAEARVAKAEAPAEAGESEDITAMRWRNRYLESRVKFLEESNAGGGTAAAVGLMAGGAAVAAAAAPKAKKPKAAAPKAAKPKEAPYKMSDAGTMTPDALEAAIVAAGAGKKPRAARSGANADELLDIIGVGPKNKTWLNEQGIYFFRQIAQMDVAELAWLSQNLPTFGTRVYRENWVAQCDRLMRGLSPKP
jgi:predicted flap endonuclease-1-like 5' DNA nuclease